MKISEMIRESEANVSAFAGAKKGKRGFRGKKRSIYRAPLATDKQRTTNYSRNLATHASIKLMQKQITHLADDDKGIITFLTKTNLNKGLRILKKYFDLKVLAPKDRKMKKGGTMKVYPVKIKAELG